MGDDIALSGQCLCGSVSFTAKSADGHVGACHCNMCRRWSGGTTLALEEARDLVIQGEDNLGVYSSSDWGERCFCKTCGTNLFWRSETFNYTAVMAGAINETDKLSFVQEIFIDSKPAYYSFANDTNKLTEAEFLAQFAETGTDGDGDSGQ